MPVDTQARHQLHKRAEEVLGPEPAGTLMELLPPVDWTQVAMKSDLVALEERLEARLGERIAQTAASTTRTVVFSVVSLTVAMMGTNVALVSALR